MKWVIGSLIGFTIAAYLFSVIALTIGVVDPNLSMIYVIPILLGSVAVGVFVAAKSTGWWIREFTS